MPPQTAASTIPACLDDRLAAAIAAGKSVAEVAAHFGVDEWAVLDRLADKTVRERIRQCQATLLDGAVGQILSLLPRAVLVLSEALLDDDVRVRRRAVEDLAIAAGKIKVPRGKPKAEQKDAMMAHLARLEQRLANSQQNS